MKRLKPSDRKRKLALYLALNWYLTDVEDGSAEYHALADENLVTYTTEEVEAHFAKRYVGRFRTKRLRKKHYDDLLAVKRNQPELQTKS